MATYKHLNELWKSREQSGLKDLIKARAIKWRHGPAIVRLEKPSRLDRARALGYRAKQGYIVARARVKHGGLTRVRPAGGRRQKRYGLVHFTPGQSLQQIAEKRVAKKYPNMKVLNSYWVWRDGKYKWFEVILVDPNHPAIKNDPKINWVSKKIN